jgi:hypothetical protein
VKMPRFLETVRLFRPSPMVARNVLGSNSRFFLADIAIFDSRLAEKPTQPLG